MEYSVFNKTTGVLQSTGVRHPCENKKDDIVIIDNLVYIFGYHYDNDEMYLDGKIVKSDFESIQALRATPEDIREGRNEALKRTDYLFSSDITLSDTKKEEWRVYRQALRDLPTHSKFPNLKEADWPTPPE